MPHSLPLVGISCERFQFYANAPGRFDLDVPQNISRHFWEILTVSYVGMLGEGVTCTIVESLTKQYPTRRIVLPEIQL